MRFEYEITEDIFVAGQLLYLKVLQNRQSLGPLAWIVGGLFFGAVAWTEEALNYASFLLGGMSLWWIYGGIANLFPSPWYRRAYRREGLAGKRYVADVGKDGFEVEGDVCSWRVRWQGVQVKGENEHVFIFYAANTIFMFGKQFLNEDQQRELRRLRGSAS